MSSTTHSGPGTPAPFSAELPSIRLDGVRTHLVSLERALDLIDSVAAGAMTAPLGVASVNLDHIHHFGASRRSARGLPPLPADSRVQWLNLVDGAPIAGAARRLTGVAHPKLSGSDLIGPILDRAQRRGGSVAVVGGSDALGGALSERLRRDWPDVRFAGQWSPTREELTDPGANERLAGQLRAAGVQIVVVCLGKPRQEEWIEAYGELTGARVLLAFGAVVDFLAGHVARAPRWVADAGFEWAWRLALEPRRLVRRYLVQGPPAYLVVRASRG